MAEKLTTRLSPRLKRRMSIKKNRFKTPDQQLEEQEEAKKKKPLVKKRKTKKSEAAKLKRVYKKKG